MDSSEADSSLSESLVVSGAVLLGITAFAVIVRAWARLYVVRVLLLDDALIILGWLLSISMCILVIVASQHGLGRNKENVSEEDYTIYLRLQIASSCSYSMGVAAAKASFAVLYLRVFPENKLLILNKFIVVFVFCQALEEVLIVVFKCNPVSKSWHPELDGRCLSLVPLWWCTFVFNLTTDLILFAQPIPSVWKLQMPLAKRVGIIAMLSLGLLVTAISIIRITYVTNIGHDDTYDLAEPLLWSEVELCALIICSCIPSLRQLAARVPGLNSLLGLSSAKASRDTYTNIGGGGWSIQLKRRRDRREYVRPSEGEGSLSNNSRRERTFGGIKPATPYGASSRVEVEALDGLSEHGSTDRIFPAPGRDGERRSNGDGDSNRHSDENGGGGIIVTHEFKSEIVTQASPEAAAVHGEASAHNHNGIEQVSPSNNVTNIEATSPRLKPRSDSNWLNR